jgi:hypothetical protein
LNDEKILCLLLLALNQAIQRQILVAGLTAYFHGEGVNKKFYGMHFRASGQGSGGSSMFE